MESQFQTKGIYRPNAQRLSISLAPLVAQRSLLFRVKADLNTRTHYSQLTPTTDESSLSENSPGLFAFTASALISAALTVASVMSAASVYSQESWRGPQTPFVSKNMLNVVDTRRHAIAFSPSVQWNDLSSAAIPVDSHQEHDMEQVSLRAAPVALPGVTPVSKEIVPMPSPVQMDFVDLPTMIVTQPEAVQVDEKAGTKLKKKKKTASSEDASSHISRRSKAFSKVMGRLSLQPSKKEIAAVDRRQTSLATIRPPMPDFKLSELKPIDNWKSVTDYKLPEVKTPGPIRMSFIINASPMPQVPTLPQVTQVSARPAKFVPPPTVSEQVVAENPTNAKKYSERLHAIMAPGTPSWRQRSLTPPPTISPALTPVLATVQPKKGHRRFRSSPAVMNFDFHGWDEESMPPLPPMPVVIPLGTKLATPSRARAQSVVSGPPGARRAVAPPFPLPRGRQASF